MMLFTLTGNLLAERTFDFDAWSLGKTQRAKHSSFQVGGKGINVTRMLQRLGVTAPALCFAGGATGTECVAWMKERKIAVHAFPTSVPTRSGLVVRTPGQPETTFLGPDAACDADAIAKAAAFLEAQADDAALAFCGSFPGWDAPATAPLRVALTRWMATRSLFVDTYGPPLAWLITQPVALIKINRDEFDLLFPEGERGMPVAQQLSSALTRWPARAWIITDGPNAVHIAARDQRVVSLTPPKVTEVSPTGSGDVFFACVLHGMLYRRMTLGDAARYALPFAAANAAHSGVAEFDLNHLPTLRS